MTAAEPTLFPVYSQDTRRKLRRAIATDIHRAVQAAPMAMTADGGEICAALAELILRRVENGDLTPVSFTSNRPQRKAVS